MPIIIKNVMLIFVFFLILVLFVKFIKINIDFELSEIDIEIDNLPLSFQNFKIAHISDMHNKVWGDRLIQRLRDSNPDIIVITGDLVDRKRSIDQMAFYVGSLSENTPVYYVSGNHEFWCNGYDKLIRKLKDKGINVIDDDIRIIKRNNDEIRLMGLMDPDSERIYLSREKSREYFNNKLSNMVGDFSGVDILLTHRPDYLKIYSDYDIDLVLSGHTHGGQIILPFIGTIYAPNQGFFPKYSFGYYKYKNTQMYISKGMASTGPTFRINCPMELAIINLRVKKS